MAASRAFIPLVERGVPAAQTYLGFTFETGRGIPQNYTGSGRTRLAQQCLDQPADPDRRGQEQPEGEELARFRPAHAQVSGWQPDRGRTYGVNAGNVV